MGTRFGVGEFPSSGVMLSVGGSRACAWQSRLVVIVVALQGSESDLVTSAILFGARFLDFRVRLVVVILVVIW